MEKPYLFILLLLIIIPNYAYCQLKDEAIQVTFTTEIKEVKLINDTLISQLKDIIFNKNEEFSKVLKEYTYIDVEPTDWNNIYIFRMGRYLSLGFLPPFGYFYLNGLCFYIKESLPPFVEFTGNKKKLVTKEYIYPTGLRFYIDDDTPSVLIEYYCKSFNVYYY